MHGGRAPCAKRPARAAPGGSNRAGHRVAERHGAPHARGQAVGAVPGLALWAPCAANWPGHATERYVGPWNAKTKTPILLISNRFDPATGYRNAQVAQRRLGNAVLLTENGFGHQSPQ